MDVLFRPKLRNKIEKRFTTGCPRKRESIDCLLVYLQKLHLRRSSGMEVERIFSADQIKIHPQLAGILREYTKAVIRANPPDIYEFSYAYFKKKVEDADNKQMREWKAETVNEAGVSAAAED